MAFRPVRLTLRLAASYPAYRRVQRAGVCRHVAWSDVGSTLSVCWVISCTAACLLPLHLIGLFVLARRQQLNRHYWQRRSPPIAFRVSSRLRHKSAPRSCLTAAKTVIGLSQNLISPISRFPCFLSACSPVSVLGQGQSCEHRASDLNDFNGGMKLTFVYRAATFCIVT